MPTIIKKSQPLLVESRRETYNTVTWHVRPNAWRPPTDMFETESSMVVKVDVAGIRDEDVEVILSGRYLSIVGVRSDPSERRSFYQMEIPYGKFVIDIELPVNVNADDAVAEYKDGFLIVHLPKEELEI